jgi:hypothetical protein
MSLDVLQSKQIDIKCKSLETDSFQASQLQTDALVLPTPSDYIGLTHNFDNNESQFQILRTPKEHVVGEQYTINSVVYVNVNYTTAYVEVFYRAYTTTTTTPPNTGWTLLGHLFNSLATYAIGDTTVNLGFNWTCIAATTPGAPFNLAEWAQGTRADNEVGTKTILRSWSNGIRTKIELGKNSKDVNAMLLLDSLTGGASELTAETGNIVFPYYDFSTIPSNLVNKVAINHDISHNFDFRIARPAGVLCKYNFYARENSASDHTIGAISEITLGGPTLTGIYGGIGTNLFTANALRITNIGNANRTQSNATLVGGTITVTTGASDPTCFIYITRTSIGLSGTPGLLYVSSKTATDFTVTSTDASDTGSFDWLILNPNFATT